MSSAESRSIRRFMSFRAACRSSTRPRPSNWPLTPSRSVRIRRYTPATLKTSPQPNDSIIPSKIGDACPIKHVLYIIKENRTYDQVLGDMKDSSGKPLGNGEPKICMFGEDVTPNQHAACPRVHLFDNFYVNSEVSVDGHAWCDMASPPITISATGSRATRSTAISPAAAARTRRWPAISGTPASATA